MKRRTASASVRSKSSVRRAADRAALMLESLELRRMLSYEAGIAVTPDVRVASSGFGSSVATQGNLALIGAPAYGESTGAAYLMDLTDPQNPIETLIDNAAAVPAEGDQFGAAVAFVGDKLAITAPAGSDGVPKVFVIDTDTNAVQTLVSPFGNLGSQSFGATIASIGDDVFVSIGTPPTSPGQVAVARYETGAGSDEAADDVYFIDSNVFGQVGMAAKDGKLLASGTLDGVATVFEIDPVTDAVTPKFTAPVEMETGQDPVFGFAIGATADSVLVSAPLTNRVYEFADGAGDNSSLFAASPSASPGMFGFSMAVNQAAGTVVIGDRDATVSIGGEGEAYAYSLAGVQLGTLQSPSAGAEDFGHAVAALPDGAFIVTDALEDVPGDSADVGAAYVFAEVESNQPPVADAGADQTVTENSTVTLDASGSSDDVGIETYEWDFDYDGTNFDADASGVTTNFPSDAPGTFTVAVRVTDGEGEVSIDTASITVTNVDPTANAGADVNTLAGQSVSLSGSGTSPDAIASYAWDLDNNGTFETSGQNVSAVFTQAGTHTVNFRVTDDDGQSAFDTALVNVASSGIVGGVLYIGGGAGSDTISVTKPGNGATGVTINGVAVPNYAGGKVVIFGGNGADTVTVSPSANVAVEVHGGAGNDTINGGSLDDILVGDGGNDSIFGGNGQDIVIGGVGADSLYGEVNDDVLVAASTSIDNNSAALTAALNAWVTSHSVAAFGSGAITADGDIDVLTGKQGNDTFFFGTEDILIDLKNDDFFLI